MAPARLARSIAAQLGPGWVLRPLNASAFSATWRAERDSAALFVKSLPAARADVLEAEAQGLEAIASTGSVAVPAPLRCWRDDPHDGAALAMTWLDLRPAGAGFGARLGEALAALHRHAPPIATFGWPRDNMLGDTPQRNRPSDLAGTAGWIAFFGRERLGAMRDRLVADGAGHAALVEAVDAVIDRLPLFFADGHVPRPSLIHGDLWSGNWGMRAEGSPVVYDPAVSVSDAEAELAMMELFGAPPPGFWPAYRAGIALHEGYAVRRPLYQLYHLLNHALLFGDGYAAQALASARRLAAGQPS